MTVNDQTPPTDMGMLLPPVVGGDGPGSTPWNWGVGDETAHHVAVVYDAVAEEVEFFFDLVSQGSFAKEGVDMSAGSARSMNQPLSFRIGNVGWSFGEQWDGVIFGAAISDVALNPRTFVLEQVPEPSTLALLLLGSLAGLVGLRFRR